MKKIFLFLILIYSLILLCKCHTLEYEEYEEIEIIEEEEDELEFDNGNEDYGYFKANLKQYLITNNLFYSNKLIEQNDLKIIFFEAITEGDPDSSPPYLRRIFEQLADYFIEKYYSEKKQIRGRDLYFLFDIVEITNKFEEFAAAQNPFLDDYDEEEDDLDSRDTIGDDL